MTGTAPDWPSVGSGLVDRPVFDFTEVFDDDYLYFYGPQLEEVSAAQAECPIAHSLSAASSRSPGPAAAP
jgi:uncharacterized protein (UPF0276 family)